MKPPHFVSQIAENEGVRSTVEALATHPKVTAAAIVGNVSAVTAINAEAITGHLALFTTATTAAVSAVMVAYWMVKLAREWAALKKDWKE